MFSQKYKKQKDTWIWEWTQECLVIVTSLVGVGGKILKTGGRKNVYTCTTVCCCPICVSTLAVCLLWVSVVAQHHVWLVLLNGNIHRIQTVEKTGRFDRLLGSLKLCIEIMNCRWCSSLTAWDDIFKNINIYLKGKSESLTFLGNSLSCRQ